MSDFVLYAKMDGDWDEYAVYGDRERFEAAIDAYFARKAAEGRPQDAADVVLGLMKVPTVVERKKMGLVKRALRHYDEIGICSELVEAIEQAKDEGAEAVGWGAADMQEVSPYDFGDMVI